MAALLPTLSGVMTAILIVLFAGIVAWAWSRRRRAAFDATARLPLYAPRTVHAVLDRKVSDVRLLPWKRASRTPDGSATATALLVVPKSIPRDKR